MGILDLLLGKKSAPPKARNSRPAGGSSSLADSQHTQGGSSASSVRKDLLKLVLRETLTRNGIPPTWLAADMLRTTSAKREPGLHVRFLVRHWDPRLMLHGVAMEREFANRLLLLDPMAQSWLMGFSWQFVLDDTSECPALPHPTTWMAPPPPSAPAPLARTGEPSSYGDVIQGPAALEPRPLDDVRGDLERLLALRDDDMRKHGPGDLSYAPTRPATL